MKILDNLFMMSINIELYEEIISTHRQLEDSPAWTSSGRY